MFTRKPTLVILIAAFAVARLWIFPIEAQQRTGEAKDSSAKIAVALQELRTTSEQLVELRQQAYQAGEISLQELTTAQRQLLEVELQLAKAPADRVNILSEQLKLATDAEEVANALYKNSKGTQSDVLQARIARLHIEVLILEQQSHAQVKQATSAKPSWEYRVAHVEKMIGEVGERDAVDESVEKHLNSLGDEGWELCQEVNGALIFKRTKVMLLSHDRGRIK